MIVYFLPNLQAGGAERVLLNLLIESNNNYPSSNLVLLLGEKKGQLLKEVPSSIPIFTLNSTRASRSVFSFIKFCRKHKPKVVFSSLGSSLTTSLAKSFVSKDIVFINRIGNTIGAEKFLYTNKVKRRLYILANKLIAKKSSHVIFQCNYMKDDYIKETKVKPKKYSIIYNPVQFKKITKNSLDNISKRFTFIAIGRLSPQKDYSSLLKACAILKEKEVKFSLAILGEGDLREALEKEIEYLSLQDNVFLLGYISNPYPYIKAAEFLVSSSLYEGFSNVIIESLCLGKPVIATDCPGGNAEVIYNGVNGFLCEVKNPLSIANTFQLGLQEVNKFDTKSIAESAKARFSSKVIFNQYFQLLKKYL